jgi:polyisoprenoid-binding protein YceI
MRLLLPLLAGSLWGQPIALRMEPAQTEVHYAVDSTLHTVHGTFKLKRGDLAFDPATGQASGELVVDATSGDSGSGARDHRMSNSILESGKFPEIVFRPDRVQGKVTSNGHSDVQLHGMFRLHGQDHELVVPIAVDADGNGYHAVAKFTVPYIKWGLKNPSTLFLRVSDKVEITVDTVARQATLQSTAFHP